MNVFGTTFRGKKNVGYSEMAIKIDIAFLFYLREGLCKIYCLYILMLAADFFLLIQTFLKTVHRRMNFKYERDAVFKTIQILFLKNLFRKIMKIFVRLAFFSVMSEMRNLYWTEGRIHFSMAVRTIEFMGRTCLTRKAVNPDNLAVLTVQQCKTVFDKILRHTGGFNQCG